ncbi:hypothetical protein Amal_04037 [Acetobacter malorum]|uniref:Uncharacterized protein n=1 Tax=Acetobacter malorum TaxID=178901 RepID=A0A177FWK6_9PROT|nr:hypothetical protein Amal_04037 [Acetobacter malorum]
MHQTCTESRPVFFQTSKTFSSPWPNHSVPFPKPLYLLTGTSPHAHQMLTSPQFHRLSDGAPLPPFCHKPDRSCKSVGHAGLCAGSNRTIPYQPHASRRQGSLSLQNDAAPQRGQTSVRSRARQRGRRNLSCLSPSGTQWWRRDDAAGNGSPCRADRHKSLHQHAQPDLHRA